MSLLFKKKKSPELKIGVGKPIEKPPFLRPREALGLMMLSVVLATIVSFIMDAMEENKPVQQNMLKRSERREMSLPRLDPAPTLPVADHTWELGADHLLTHQDEVSHHITGLNGRSLLWLNKQIPFDQKNKPLAQGFEIDDILGYALPTGEVAYVIPDGTPTFVDGILVDQCNAEEDGSKQWMVIAVATDAEEQANRYMLVLSWDVGKELVIGDPVRAIGRYMGGLDVQGVSKKESVPLLAARRMIAITEDAQMDYNEKRLPGVGGAHDVEDLDAMWTSVDDKLQVLELVPYYHLLGQVKIADAYRNDAYDTTLDAGELSVELGFEPSSYRGKAFTLRATVLDVTIDELIEKDKPWGIQRVWRVRLWARHKGLYRERDITGTVTESEKSILHAYELAIIADEGEEPPIPGSIIEANCRFLKIHGVFVERAKRRDKRRHSDTSYLKFFVADSYKDVTPPPENNTILRIVIMTLSVGFGLAMYFIVRNDGELSNKRMAAIRKMRENKRNYKKRQAADGSGANLNNESQEAEPETREET